MIWNSIYVIFLIIFVCWKNTKCKTNFCYVAWSFRAYFLTTWLSISLSLLFATIVVFLRLILKWPFIWTCYPQSTVCSIFARFIMRKFSHHFFVVCFWLRQLFLSTDSLPIHSSLTTFQRSDSDQFCYLN